MSFFGNLFSSKLSKTSERIYLDYASATPLDNEVFELMRPYLVGYIGNPSSVYQEGVEAKKVLDRARKEIGELLNTPANSVIFTSGGTESNNIAIQGTFYAAKKAGISEPHFITTAIEHSSVLKVFSFLESQGAKVSYVNPDENGNVYVESIKKELTQNTVLVSVMLVNNEIGTILPVKEIARAVKLYKKEKDFPYVHTDASQAVCDMPISVMSLGVDLLTIDGLKMYGPRGAGILVKKRSVEILPITFGGGQEFGLRPGTEVVANAVGLAGALKKAVHMIPEEAERISTLKNFFETEIKKINFGKRVLTIHGEPVERVSKISNVCISGIDAEFWTILFDKEGVCISFVSACQNLNEDSSSYVLKAMGNADCASSSLRFSFGRETTKSEIKKVLKILTQLSTAY